MREKNIRHLVVMDGNRVVGVLSDRELGGKAQHVATPRVTTETLNKIARCGLSGS